MEAKDKDMNQQEQLDMLLDQLEQLNEQAMQMYWEGQYEQAIYFAMQVYHLARFLFGETHSQVANSLINLSLFYQLSGNYAAAEPLMQEIVAIWRISKGETDPMVASSLNKLALLYYKMGRYAEAEPLYQQALTIWRATGGEKHLDFAITLDNLALLYCTMGLYIEAESLYQQALTIWRATVGDEHQDFATNQQNLAALYSEMGRYSEAEPLYRNALKIQITALGEHHPKVGSVLNNLALLYYNMGRYSEAEPLFHQALEVFSITLEETHPDVAMCQNNLAALYQAFGKYAEAASLYQQVLDIQRAVLGDHHLDVGHSLNNLANLYCTMGRYSEAEPLLHQALEVYRAVNNYPAIARVLSNLALLYKPLKGIAAYEPLQDLPNVMLCFTSVENGTAAEQLYLEALEIRRTVLGEGHPDVGQNLQNLAALYSEMGHYSKAEPLFHEALEVYNATLDETHPNVITCRNNLAALYTATGRDVEAASLLQQVLEMQRTVLGEENLDYASYQNNLGVLYYNTGRYTEAEPLLRQALEIRRTLLGEHHPYTAQSQSTLAELFLATKNVSEALTLMKQVAAFDDWMITQVLYSPERQRTNYLRKLRGKLSEFLSIVLRHLSSNPEAVQAALDLVLRRKAIGVEALTVQRDIILTGRYPMLESKFRELIDLRRQIGQKVLDTPDNSKIPEFFHHTLLLNKLDEQKDQLEAELAHQIPEIDLSQHLRSAERYVIAQTLPIGAVLVEFFRSTHYLAFVLHAGKPDTVQMIDLGTAKLIEQLIADFRISITGEAERRGILDVETRPNELNLGVGAPDLSTTNQLNNSNLRHLEPLQLHSATDMSPGAALRAQIFDPLLIALGNCTRLFLSTDGDLTRLPFETLPTTDGRYLIDDYCISYLSVGRDVLRFNAATTGQPTAPLVIADPDFDLSICNASALVEATELSCHQSPDLTPNTLHFERLPGTHMEGEQVSALLGVQPLLGGSVMKTEIKACRSPRILHIATHGFFLPTEKSTLDIDDIDLQESDPNLRGIDRIDSGLGRFSGKMVENPLLLSGLALSGANTWLQHGALPAEAENGILTAEDVLGLDLLSTELVVLSACETGLGKIHVSEGIFGLQRAFVLSGAKTLVMSLWKVPDQQTQELMVDFYRRLLDGQPRADALREAQLTMKAKYSNPLYWGAFICQGNPYSMP